MTIRAVLKNGQIQPIDPLPSGWAEGQELMVDGPTSADRRSAEIDQWERELETLIDRIPADEQERFQRALDEIEQESKESVRRAWGMK